LDTNRASLAAEEAQVIELSNRRIEIDNKKRDVEENIMRGFNTNSNPGTPVGIVEGSPGTHQSPVTPAPEPDRPEVEALTPPGYPMPPVTESVPEFELNTSNGNHAQYQPPPSVPGSDLLSSLSTAYGRSPSGSSIKKRKLNSGDDFPDLGGDAMDGLDADVAEMLRRDSGGGM